MSTQVSAGWIAAAVVLVVLVGADPAAAASVRCEGRCEDGFGNVRIVENACDDVAERCVAGCDRSGGGAEPYAECEASGRAARPPLPPPENPGGVRVRDGE